MRSASLAGRKKCLLKKPTTKAGRPPDKLVPLNAAQRILKAVLTRALSRPTLIGYIESVEARGARHSFNNYYYIYKSVSTSLFGNMPAGAA